MKGYELISIIALIALIGSICPAYGVDSEENALDEGLVIPICRYINASETHLMNLSVSSNIAFASFLLDWWGATSVLEMVLISPSGTHIDSSVEGPITYNESVSSGVNSIYYVVPDPEPGVWTAEIRALDVPESGEEYCSYSVLDEDESMLDIESNSSDEEILPEECETCSSG